jgi:hypothetical protein
MLSVRIPCVGPQAWSMGTEARHQARVDGGAWLLFHRAHNLTLASDPRHETRETFLFWAIGGRGT